MKSKIKTAQEIVEEILTDDRNARNSDTVLMLKVYQKLMSEKGIDITTITFPRFLASMKTLGLPSFETIRRTRQKLQADNLYLRSDKDIAEAREELQKVFREYARGIE